MTRISKCLVVVVAAASLAFLGFVLIGVAGGPNWEAEADKLEGFVFEKSDGEAPTWSVRARMSGETIGGATPVLPSAIIAARNQLKKDQQAELQSLNDQIAVVKPRPEAAKTLNEADVAAMIRRNEELKAELKQLNDSIDELAEQGVLVSQQAQAIQAETTNRREDVFRLRSQLEEIRTDRYRTEQQQSKLRDLLTRLEGDIDRLKRRRDQLQEAGAKLN